MKIVGIICEYNPLHLGHKKQMDQIRRIHGDNTAIVCLMSGNFVQRGAPAILDKSVRAEAALNCGADLVLELPLEYALSSAEGFAAGGVRILGRFCDYLCFGAEDANTDALLETARVLLSDTFPPLLKQQLETGKSFPAAREAALVQMGLNGSLLATPNNILAVEYCKAILHQNVPMEPMPIFRGGSYHDEKADPENPSATSLRTLMAAGDPFDSFIPEGCRIFRDAPLHTLGAGERAILSKLHTMTDEEFEALPYGSEGLWRKLMHACRSEATLEAIIAATKSKRYTRTRIDRMILCAFLGLSREDLMTEPPYTRVLGFTNRGRAVLKEARKTGSFPNAGQIIPGVYWERERRTGDLYGIFCTAEPEAPGKENTRRIIYKSE